MSVANMNDFLALIQRSGAMAASGGAVGAGGGITMIGGPGYGTEYGIKPEDLACWNNYIVGRTKAESRKKAFQRMINEGRTHLFIQTIGNPNDPFAAMMRNNEVGYGNTILHDLVVNASDESVLKITNKLALQHGKADITTKLEGFEFLIEYLSGKITKKPTKEFVRKCITALDAQGKTPVLLACKNLNARLALQLLTLDVERLTINLADNIMKYTPLHIACILGLQSVAKKLIEMGADVSKKDSHGNTPAFYLSCDRKIAEKNIDNILESVNFFYGGNYGASDKLNSIALLFTKREACKKELLEVMVKHLGDSKKPEKTTLSSNASAAATNASAAGPATTVAPAPSATAGPVTANVLTGTKSVGSAVTDTVAKQNRKARRKGIIAKNVSATTALPAGAAAPAAASTTAAASAVSAIPAASATTAPIGAAAASAATPAAISTTITESLTTTANSVTNRILFSTEGKIATSEGKIATFMQQTVENDTASDKRTLQRKSF